MARLRKSLRKPIGSEATVNIPPCVDRVDERPSPQLRNLVGVRVACDLPISFSPTKAEVALLRAFLADEINAILLDGD